MSEPFINDTTPKSSPILAYGESSPSLVGRFGVIVGGIVAAMLVASIVAVIAARKIPFPASPSIAIGISAGTPLPETAPEIWRVAQQRARPLPIIVGFAGAQHQTPYVIAPRYALPNAVAHTTIWALEGQNIGVDATTTPITAVAPTIFSWPWLRIWPSRLLPIVNITLSDESTSIAGPMTGSSWLTDLSAPNAVSHNPLLLEGQNGIDLVAIPEAWPYLVNMLRADGIALDERQPPSSMRWARKADGELAIALTLLNGAPSSSMMVVDPNSDFISKKSLKLVDGDIVEELFATGTAADQTFLGDAQAATLPWVQLIDCPGTTMAFFTVPQISPFFPASRFIWTADRGHIRVCWD